MIKKGFTLIELLITIAIIGVLSAAVIVGINPAQKIAQANDSKVKSDIGQIATAAQSYMTTNQSFPVTGAAGITALVNSKDLGATPSTTVTYVAYLTTGTTTACNGTTTMCSAFSVYATLNAPQTASDVWCYRSASGIAAEVATPATNCQP